ncbi:MAG: hypothetical protein AAFY41_05290 [Bacteroidota bacterium]
MRFPSLFRLPKHQQFRIQPRYYDPVKEEIRERTERIKEEMEGKESGDYKPSKINFKRKKASQRSSSFTQLMIAASLGALIFGWLEYGNEIFQVYSIIILGVYLIYRLKKLRKNNR